MPRWLVLSAGIIVGGPKRDLRGAPKRRSDQYLVAFAHVAARAGLDHLGVSRRQAERNLADARAHDLIDETGELTIRGVRLHEALKVIHATRRRQSSASTVDVASWPAGGDDYGASRAAGLHLGRVRDGLG